MWGKVLFNFFVHTAGETSRLELPCSKEIMCQSTYEMERSYKTTNGVYKKTCHIKL